MQYLGSFTVFGIYIWWGIIHSWQKVLIDFTTAFISCCIYFCNPVIVEANSSISCSSKSVISFWDSNKFPWKNFSFVLLSCSSMSLFIWLIFMVIIDFFPDLFYFVLPIASSFFCFWSSRYLVGTLRFLLKVRLSPTTFFLFASMIAIQKWWKMLFISSWKLFSFSRYSNFCLDILGM